METEKKSRPKLRWCDELKEDVEQAECRQCRLNIQSRQEWRKLIEEVKSAQGCSAIGRRKS
jgi:hypothetical protein